MEEGVGSSDEEKKERCMEAYREEKRKVKRFIIQSKKKVNEQFEIYTRLKRKSQVLSNVYKVVCIQITMIRLIIITKQ